MGAWGAIVMGFFGALFAAMTLSWQFHLAGPVLALPFLGFAALGLGAALALVVGLHFLRIAHAAAFRPLYVLGSGLMIGAIAGFMIPAPVGGAISGFGAMAGLWTASGAALLRDMRFRQASLTA